MPCRLLGLFLLVSLFAGAGHAAPLYTLGAPVTPADKSEASLRRVAPATLNPALFSLSTRAKGGWLNFPLFDGEATGVIAHTRETAPDDFSVAGELVAGRSGNFTLTVRGGHHAALPILDDTGAMIRLTGTPGAGSSSRYPASPDRPSPTTEAQTIAVTGQRQIPTTQQCTGMVSRLVWAGLQGHASGWPQEAYRLYKVPGLV